MARVKVALVAGLVLTAIAIGVTLTRSPPVVAGSNLIKTNTPIVETQSRARACQADEHLPPGTTAIRLSAYALFGPRVTVTVFSGGRLLTSGVRDAGWIGESPTVAVRPVSSGASHVKVCFMFGQADGLVTLFGNYARPAEQVTGVSGVRLGGRIRIDYLKSGSRSWLSLWSSVARHMGLGHWAAGTWIVMLEIALIMGIFAGASWLTVKELR